MPLSQLEFDVHSDDSIVEIEKPEKPPPPVVELEVDNSLVLNVNTTQLVNSVQVVTKVTSVCVDAAIVTPMKSCGTSQNSDDLDSPYHWTADMVKFYNDEENLEIFDVQAIQKAMPNNRHMWEPGPVKSGKSRRERRLHCLNCQGFGHDERQCRRYCCRMCGEDGHQLKFCPKTCCLSCGKRTKRAYVNACDDCIRKRKKRCSRCQVYGHIVVDCTDHWRRFHHVTVLGAVQPPSGPVLKPRDELWCCNCARKGHVEINCKARRDELFGPSSTLVCSYAREFNFDRADVGPGNTSPQPICTTPDYVATQATPVVLSVKQDSPAYIPLSTCEQPIRKRDSQLAIIDTPVNEAKKRKASASSSGSLGTANRKKMRYFDIPDPSSDNNNGSVIEAEQAEASITPSDSLLPTNNPGIFIVQNIAKVIDLTTENELTPHKKAILKMSDLRHRKARPLVAKGKVPKKNAKALLEQEATPPNKGKSKKGKVLDVITINSPKKSKRHVPMLANSNSNKLTNSQKKKNKRMSKELVKKKFQTTQSMNSQQEISGATQQVVIAQNEKERNKKNVGTSNNAQINEIGENRQIAAINNHSDQTIQRNPSYLFSENEVQGAKPNNGAYRESQPRSPKSRGRGRINNAVHNSQRFHKEFRPRNNRGGGGYNRNYPPWQWQQQPQPQPYHNDAPSFAPLRQQRYFDRPINRNNYQRGLTGQKEINEWHNFVMRTERN